jgi:hypothetical protein
MPKEEVDKLLKTGTKPLDALETGLKNNFISKTKNMTPFVAEIIGTMLLILLGNGVVANVVLKKQKAVQDGLLLPLDGHLPFS